MRQDSILKVEQVISIQPQTYTSPIEYSCQRNYVVIITDGDSTKDRNSVLKNGATGFPAIGDQDGDGFEPGGAHEKIYLDGGQNLDGSDYLDDVAMYLYQTDRRST